MRNGSLLSGLLLLLMASAGRCSVAPDTPTARPGILLISIDTLRPDHTSAYGYRRHTTPALESLAAEGALFRQAVSTTNWTLPAHVSLLTGLYPSLHHVEDQRDALTPDLRTLAAVLREHGYATAAFTSYTYLEARYGLDLGFESYETVVDQRAEEVTGKALAWLQDAGPAPFFLFLHYFDPHWDYRPPASFQDRFGVRDAENGTLSRLYPYFDSKNVMPAEVKQDVLALYDGEIAYTDQQVGLLLDHLRSTGRLDSTIVAVVSDHGEEFGEHGFFGHGTHLHGEVTRVPMILRFPPRLSGGQQRDDVATLADIPATLVALAGLEAEPQFLRHGRDLAAAGTDRHVFLESTRWGPKRFAVRTSDHLFLGGGYFRPLSFVTSGDALQPVSLQPVPFLPQLYDIVNDPEEKHDLVTEVASANRTREFQDLLQDYISTTVDGLRLSCRSVEKGAWYTGRLGLPAALTDEAFASRPGPRAGLATRSPTDLEFRLQPDKGGLSLILPLAGMSGDLRVLLQRQGVELYSGALSFPAAGEAVPLGEGTDEEGCHLTLPVPKRVASGRGAVELDEDDLRALRSLGYVE